MVTTVAKRHHCHLLVTAHSACQHVGFHLFISFFIEHYRGNQVLLFTRPGKCKYCALAFRFFWSVISSCSRIPALLSDSYWWNKIDFHLRMKIPQVQKFAFHNTMLYYTFIPQCELPDDWVYGNRNAMCHGDQIQQKVSGAGRSPSFIFAEGLNLLSRWELSICQCDKTLLSASSFSTSATPLITWWVLLIADHQTEKYSSNLSCSRRCSSICDMNFTHLSIKHNCY